MLWRPAPQPWVWRDRPLPIEATGFFVGLASADRLADARRWLRLLDGSFPNPPARLLLLGHPQLADAFPPSFAARITVCDGAVWADWLADDSVFAGRANGSLAQIAVMGPPTDAGWDLLEASAPTA